MSIDAGTPLPPSGDVEPNDDLTTATALSGAFAISGDLRDSQDVYRWTTPDLADGQAWDVQLTGALTSGAQVSIQDATGTTLASAYPDALGRAELADLRLPAGDHFLFVTPSTSVSMPYGLSATAGDLGNADPEPNSVVAVAVPLDPARPIVHGRLAAGDNRDWYSLDVDQTLAASLLDIRLIWRSGPARTLCLADAAGTELQCRNGDHGVSLSGLHLSPGVAMLEVSGDPSDGSVYLLRVDPTTSPAADFESEPNDTPSTASAVSGLTMHGHLATDDRDTFLVTTTGEPQLWQVDVTGTGINALIWEKADGTELGLGDVAEDHSSAHATDLYLVPGEHWLRVDGSDGDYTLAMTALGPPDPNGEREPNNASINAEPFIIGSTRTGRLPSYQDVDIFRFTVDTTDHLRITVTPPSRWRRAHDPLERHERGRRHHGRRGRADGLRRAAGTRRLGAHAPARHAKPGQVRPGRGARGSVRHRGRTRSPTTASPRPGPCPPACTSRVMPRPVGMTTGSCWGRCPPAGTCRSGRPDPCSASWCPTV